jgi:hypothetical protein
MSLASVRSPSPPLAGAAHRFFLRLCTSNPFYVISAGIFLVGLYASFSGTASDDEAWALMSGLAGYTLLLAVTALVLVRFANAWDDLRTVLLLVVLMFLATSVTFDEVLVLEPERGTAYYLAGLVFAVLVSEAVLHGIRLRLPALFRVPYYLILALFFLYPLALSLLEPPAGMVAPQDAPLDETLMWALFGFTPIAGLVFLTLLPAIRRGTAYVQINGSPWPWPLYPWTLFGLLGLAVPARSFLLCYSMHLVDGLNHGNLIFGLYFIVPFGLCAAVLLLEIGLVAGRRSVQRVALALPIVLALLAAIGHRGDPVYQEFLETFTTRLLGTPLFLTLVAATGFYMYAALRRAPMALAHVTAALGALAFVGPETRALDSLVSPHVIPLLAAAVLQVTLGIARRNAWHSAVGAVGLAVAIAVALPAIPGSGAWRGASLFHLAVLAVLIVGTVFDDNAGLFLRAAAIGILFLAGLTATLAALNRSNDQLPAWLLLYPPSVSVVLGVYGRLLRHRSVEVLAGLAFASWLGTAGWRGYMALRPIVSGLDQIALGLSVFVVAVLISLGKSGTLSRWFHYLSDRVYRWFDYSLDSQQVPGN